MAITDYKSTAEPKATAGGVPVFCAHDAIVEVEKLVPNPKNPNKHPEEQIALLGRIIKATGWRQPITVSNRSGFIVKGHGRLLAALGAGLTAVPVDYQEYTSEAEEYADLVADNRLAELSEIDNAMLADVFQEIDLSDIPAELTGYTADEISDITDALMESVSEPQEADDEIPEPPRELVTRTGDIWILGRHRVMCGDCTSKENRTLLFNGAEPQILLTDPPYCSGGFQEAGRSAGSIGSKAKDKWGGAYPTVANDTLSTRGYQALIKNILTEISCQITYIFTDWRMWVYLFDLVEGCGYGVKNMLVWDKKTAGMGMGWRAQHELICFGSKAKLSNFDMTKSYSNVLTCTRSGNPLHPTQKPVELIGMILDNTDWAEGVFDPFGGSGTTLIACENYKQSCYTMELEPKYVDCIVQRYMLATNSTDGVELIRNGKKQPHAVWEPLLDVIGDIEE